jgi:sec-independent protein translocase protein TatA
MPFNIGPFELLLVLILALLVLGPGKLPEVGSAIGKTLREFRRATSEVDETVKAADLNRPTPARPAPEAAPVERTEIVEREESRAPGN